MQFLWQFVIILGMKSGQFFCNTYSVANVIVDHAVNTPSFRMSVRKFVTVGHFMGVL
jgi:hypothetical protein